MAKRVIERRVRKVVEGHSFHVPAPEERILISALQRVYRHFYFRLCDTIDMALMIQTEPADFGQLRKTADLAGIWPGVATFLVMIRSYITSYGGEFPLPSRRDMRALLRLPLLPPLALSALVAHGLTGHD